MLDHAQEPAVLLAHNTPGVGDLERGVARRLAGPGYVVLCVDYVGTGELLSMDQVQSCWAMLNLLEEGIGKPGAPQ